MRGIPDYDHPYGLIRFDRSAKLNGTAPDAESTDAKQADDEDFQAFQGQGFSLKKGRK